MPTNVGYSEARASVIDEALTERNKTQMSSFPHNFSQQGRSGVDDITSHSGKRDAREESWQNEANEKYS